MKKKEEWEEATAVLDGAYSYLLRQADEASGKEHLALLQASMIIAKAGLSVVSEPTVN